MTGNIWPETPRMAKRSLISFPRRFHLRHRRYPRWGTRRRDQPTNLPDGVTLKARFLHAESCPKDQSGKLRRCYSRASSAGTLTSFSRIHITSPRGPVCGGPTAASSTDTVNSPLEEHKSDATTGNELWKNEKTMRSFPRRRSRRRHPSPPPPASF